MLASNLVTRVALNCISRTSLPFMIPSPTILKYPFATTKRIMSSGPIYTVEYLSSKLQNELQAEHVEIEDLSNCGCGMKFDALIVSPQFEGKPILQRQRLVNQILAEEMKHIHAFTMKTLTPSQWDKNQKIV